MSDLFGADYEERKSIPIFDGVVMYFPKALAAVAQVSHAGNAQHNPGEPLHWARGKSMDQYNTALRHMMDHRMGGGRTYGENPDWKYNNGWLNERFDKDGVRHLAKAAWRILAALELDIEADEVESKEKGQPVKPVSPGLPVSAPVSTRATAEKGGLCACGNFIFKPWHNSLAPSVVANGKTHTPWECV